MNNKDALVSIIVPCYNGKRFVDACMSTLLAQTYKKLEVVVVDDGSSDGSHTLIESYVNLFADNDMVLKCIRQENRGLAGAISTGLKHISGEFLQLLDIDDLLEPSSVEDKLSLFTQDVAIVRANGKSVKAGEDDGILFADGKASGEEKMLFEELVLSKTYNWAGSYMVRTKPLFEFYPDRSIYPSRHGQNLQILMPLAYKHKCVFLDKPLMKYVKWDNSLSASTGSNDAYGKLEANMLGYTDIRHYMLNLIMGDTVEKKQFEHLVDQRAWTYLLELACDYGNKTAAKRYYNKLKKINALTRDSKYVYWCFRYPIIKKLKG